MAALKSARTYRANRTRSSSRKKGVVASASTQLPASSLSALLWDIDGVILESEDLHRRSYNQAFAKHNIRSASSGGLVQWSTELYDSMSNSIGGGKPKMRWFFGEHDGWPVSDLSMSNEQLVDLIQEEKNSIYQNTIASGAVPPRPGVLNMMDEAFSLGIPMALCSASTRSSAEQTVYSLLGEERVNKIGCFLAGDDVGDAKKPDPYIYNVAMHKLGIVEPSNVLVIEDSGIGVAAATSAGCRCIVTYTRTGINEAFEGAERIISGLHKVSLNDIAVSPERQVDDRATAPAQ